MERNHSIHEASGEAIPGGEKPPPARTAARLRWGSAVLVALVCLGLGLPAAAGRIFMFEDENGVTHFTNNPRGDRRYRPMPRQGLAASIPRHEAPQTNVYDGLIGQAARDHRVPPALVKAVIAAESAFDSRAVSRRGARGLMQLMPSTAEQLGVRDAFEPAENVRGGASYLRHMIDRYGDLTRALAAYNAGPAAVDRYGGVPPYRETRDYVERVLTYYRRYHGDFAR